MVLILGSSGLLHMKIIGTYVSLSIPPRVCSPLDRYSKLSWTKTHFLL